MTAYTKTGTPTKRDSIDMNAKPFQLPKNSTLLKDSINSRRRQYLSNYDTRRSKKFEAKKE
jgi:hypothetical protein